jgi:hypothetical protein
LGTSRIDGLTAEGLPDLLTVEEAAALLRIGRNQAYDLTRQWRATNGKSGLPVVEFGRHTLRVPRHALERLIGAELTGPLPVGPPLVMVPAQADPTGPGWEAGSRPSGNAGEPAGASDQAEPAPRAKVTPIRRPRHSGASDQLPLFDLPAGQPPERS